MRYHTDISATSEAYAIVTAQQQTGQSSNFDEGGEGGHTDVAIEAGDGQRL